MMFGSLSNRLIILNVRRKVRAPYHYYIMMKIIGNADQFASNGKRGTVPQRQY